jgi:hypothetical protein
MKYWYNWSDVSRFASMSALHRSEKKVRNDVVVMSVWR